MELPDRD